MTTLIEKAHDTLGPQLFQGNKTRAKQQANLHKAVELLRGQDIEEIDFTPLLEGLQGRSPATVNRYLSSLKALLDAYGASYTIPWKREPKGRKRWLDKEEIGELLKHTQNYPNKKLGEAVAAYIKLSLLFGTRRSELLGIDFNRDVRYDKQNDVYWVTLKGTKNGEDRVIACGHDAYELLQRFSPWDSSKTGSIDFGGALYRVWEGVRKAMGLSEDSDFTPHALRHSHATTRLEMGDTIKDLQDALGHRDIRSTARYAHVTPSRRLATAKRLQEKVLY